jgi:hypothetical protein
MSKSMNAAIVEAVFGDLEGRDSCVARRMRGMDLVGDRHGPGEVAR